MTREEKLHIYYSELALTFPIQVQEALSLIGNGHYNHQLLALRRYIRRSGVLTTNWTWSLSKMRQYLASPQYAQVLTRINLVKNKFIEMNPGFSLGISPIRDLASQVRLWNKNSTVHHASEYLVSRCLREIEHYPELCSRRELDTFRSYLENTHVTPEPTSAAPGLSDHGQMNAVDFVILEGHDVIAGTNSSTIPIIWESSGWTRKLKIAITQSGSGFQGPLRTPYEPWHYSLPH